MTQATSLQTKREGLTVIRDSSRIKAKLLRLFRSNSPVGMRIAGKRSFTNSWVIFMVRGGNTYLIERVPEDEVHNQLVPGTTIECTAGIDGGKASWESRISIVREAEEAVPPSALGSKKSDERPPMAYVMTVPASMSYIQRRDYFRAKPSLKQGVVGEIKRGAELIEKIDLFDLSLNGVGYFCNVRVTDFKLEVGDKLTNTVTLQNHKATFLSEIVWVEHKKYGVGIRFGCKITKADGANKDALSRIVTKIQLDQLADENERGYRL